MYKYVLQQKQKNLICVQRPNVGGMLLMLLLPTSNEVSLLSSVMKIMNIMMMTTNTMMKMKIKFDNHNDKHNR